MDAQTTIAPTETTQAEADAPRAYAVLFEDGELAVGARAADPAGRAVHSSWEFNPDLGADLTRRDADARTATVPWHREAARVEAVSFVRGADGAEFAPRYMRRWFRGCKNLTRVDWSNLDASRVETLS
jgi:surface protein